MRRCGMEEMGAIKEKLQRIGQTQLLDALDALRAQGDEDAAARLSDQLSQLDFDTLAAIRAQFFSSNASRSDETNALPYELDKLQPAQYVTLEAQNEQRESGEQEKFVSAGEQLVKQGKVAAVLVAGGQGSRLGFHGPKGAYKVSAARAKPLFQLFAEQLLAVMKKHNAVVPWYVMTSSANDEATRSFFKEHQYFGLDPDNVVFFVQGQLPAWDFSGRLIRERKDSLFMAPDGHGGCLKALKVSGALDDMKRRGIEHVSYFQVDNPLVSIVDIEFLGRHVIKGSEIACRVLRKRDAKEGLGNFCIYEDKLMIIEYSDLPDELANKRVAGGDELMFSAGSPSIMIFQLAFVERLLSDDSELSLPFHEARKKIPYVDEDGNRVDEPAEKNGCKFEMFVFDALPAAKSTLLVEAPRDTSFAPVKNPEGADSPDSCRAYMMNMHASWLEACGIQVPKKDDGQSVDCVIEISSLLATSAAELQVAIDKGLAKAEIPRELERGRTYYFE
ncbi:UDP-N-acetylhexosamine pyrophosphorylase [Porphyridium purpureum]|uniref:UDP-N-acetylglucosamine diphosphorylase n=1 Tax=Porphyridium purpureum TaxID=35688 RepID=A0A5J4Z0G7_PORPP|nr:UDP-N-acetylhexosamine pyrophosphorylase [Porphyridium purpureum]|eukprot:POR1278..scf209_3